MAHLSVCDTCEEADRSVDKPERPLVPAKWSVRARAKAASEVRTIQTLDACWSHIGITATHLASAHSSKSDFLDILCELLSE